MPSWEPQRGEKKSKWLHNPSNLGGPNHLGDPKARERYLTDDTIPAILGTQMWGKKCKPHRLGEEIKVDI